MKIQRKIGGSGWGDVRLGGQGGWERRIEVFVKIRVGGQGRCER